MESYREYFGGGRYCQHSAQTDYYGNTLDEVHHSVFYYIYMQYFVFPPSCFCFSSWQDLRNQSKRRQLCEQGQQERGGRGCCTSCLHSEQQKKCPKKQTNFEYICIKCHLCKFQLWPARAPPPHNSVCKYLHSFVCCKNCKKKKN